MARSNYLNGHMHRFVKCKPIVFIYFFFIACLMISFLFWGIYSENYIADEGYMAMCCKNWRISPLAMLTFFQGHIWTSIFGENVIALRILAKISQLLAVGIGCWYLFKRSKNIVLTVTAGLITVIVSFFANHQLYNWDNGAYPAEALFTVMLMLYIANPSLNKIRMLGLISGLMICYRLPLGIGVVISGAAIIVRTISSTYTLKNIIVNLLWYVSVMILTLMCMLWIMCGSITNIFESFNPDNFISGHNSLLRLLIPPTHRIERILPSLISSSSVSFIAFLAAALFSGYKKIPMWLNILLISWLSMCALVEMYICFSNDLRLMPGICIPMLLCTLLFVPIHKSLQNKKEIRNPQNKVFTFQLIFLSVCILLPVIGSDTWFERFTPCYGFPIALAVIWPKLEYRGKRVFKLFLAYLIIPISVMFPLKVNWLKLRGSTQDIAKWGHKIGTGTLSEQLNLIEPFVSLLKSNQISYSFWGTGERYLMNYALGNIKDNQGLSYPLHIFYIVDVPDKNIDAMSKDDVIIIPKSSIGGLMNSVEYLKKKYGYKETEYQGNFVLLITPNTWTKLGHYLNR